MSNLAQSGSTIIQMAQRSAAAYSAIKTGEKNIIVVWIGVNDAANFYAQDIYDSISAYCYARKAAGWNVVICTEIAAGVGGIGEPWSSKYLDINNRIRNNHAFADYLCDLGADARLQDCNNLTYFAADKIHPSTTGATVIATLIANTLSSLV